MTSTSTPIITKVLLPQKRPSLLHRSRLVNFIHENIEHKLLLVSAGAGYGKTSLLTDYVHDTDLPVCWLSLDEADRDLGVFVDYLLTAIRYRFPDFGQSTQQTLQNANGGLDYRTLAGSVATDLYQDIRDYFVLVLDDYHLMDTSVAVNQFMDLLLRHLPENCHIILSSRTLPTKLTLTRLVARQEVAGLGVSDLRFTSAEIKALVRQNYDREISDEKAQELTEQSEGWITGILLTSHNLWQGLFKNMLQIQGDEGQIFDYLATEVFDRQPRALQDFLIYSSVFDRMTPDLCNILLGTKNARETLESLERQNLFVFQLGDDWYRYHHLFRAFLTNKAKTETPAKFDALRAKAGDLFATQGLYRDAIPYYLKAKDWAQAAETIKKVAPDLWEQGQWDTLVKWIETVPKALLPQHPWLIHFQAKVQMEKGQLNQAANSFATAREQFSRINDRQGVAAALVEETIASYQIGDTDRAIETAQEALATLDDDQILLKGRARRALGTSLALKGDLDQAIQELEKARDLYERLEQPYDLALVHHDLGLAYDRTGNTPLSKLHLEKALKYWQRANNLAGLANTLNSLGVLLHTQGEYEEALETFEDALHKIRQVGGLQIEPYILASIGDLYRDINKPEKALEAYEQALEIGKRKEIVFIVLYTLLGIGRAYCTQSNLEAAHYYIEQAREIAESSQSNYNLGLYKLHRGVLLYRQQKLRESEKVLSEAADIFRSGNNKQEQCRACLHLGQVALLDGREADAKVYLEIVARLAGELGYTEFLAAEGRTVPDAIRHGSQKKIGQGLFRQIGTRMRELFHLETDPLAEPAKTTEVIDRPNLIEIYALGNSRVLMDGELVTKSDWGASAAKELFFLLLTRPEGLHKEQIIEALWPDTSPSKGNSRFHSTTYRLRRALYQECLIREGSTYLLQLDVPYTYDVARFDQLVSKAKSHNGGQEIDNYQKAADLYEGDYLANIYSSWSSKEQERLRHEYLNVLVYLSTHHLREGNYEDCLSLSQEALTIDAFSEEIYRQIMHCYARLGNRTAALKSYEKCSEMLQNELGVEPAPETEILCERIINNRF
jgi:ATP/maltotriose-dependent transcriptional regulator MalT/DNA-binding SARP family transcriptional activator